jgi:hypothetical protein
MQEECILSIEFKSKRRHGRVLARRVLHHVNKPIVLLPFAFDLTGPSLLDVFVTYVVSSIVESRVDDSCHASNGLVVGDSDELLG